jgi:hypothetical protein
MLALLRQIPWARLAKIYGAFAVVHVFAKILRK